MPVRAWGQYFCPTTEKTTLGAAERRARRKARRAAGRSVAPPHAAGQYQFRVKIQRGNWYLLASSAAPHRRRAAWKKRVSPKAE
jgi:hypothetical protein